MALAATEARSELEGLIEELRPLTKYLTESQLTFFARCEFERRQRVICKEEGHPNARITSRFIPYLITVEMYCPDCKEIYFRGVTNEDIEEYWSLYRHSERKD